MRLRTTALLATAAAAATSIVLLTGCGGSASEASAPEATSTAPIRQAAGGDGSSYAAAITSLSGGPAYTRAVYEVVNDHCIRTGFKGQYGTGNSYSCGLADSLRCFVTGAGCESREGEGPFGRMIR